MTVRVLYLTMNPNRASTTVPTECWLRLLPARGLEPVLVSSHVGELHAWTQAQGIPAYQVPLHSPNKWWPWRLWRSLWRLRGIVRQHRIELIHCNEHDVYPIAQYLGRLCDIPVAVSIHFTVSREFCEWAFRGARCPQRIFFLSQGSIEACRPSVAGIIPEARWRLLYNGLDLSEVRPDAMIGRAFRQQHGLNGDLLIGNACLFQPRKQLEHLFDAAARLPDRSVKVVVAGRPRPGDEAYASELIEAGRRKLGRRLIHVGHLSNLRGLCNALDLFVNTSKEEICSISVLEALACGCPVVGYPSKSVDEQILPAGGEIVRQDNSDELTTVLAAWVHDRQRLSEARIGARRRAEEAFDIRKRADQLWNEYEGLIAEGRSEASNG
jgi:glycosyltransferase involved in cell wall biosynthesis